MTYNFLNVLKDDNVLHKTLIQYTFFDPQQKEKRVGLQISSRVKNDFMSKFLHEALNILIMCKVVYPLKETQRVFYGGQCNLLMFNYFDMFDDIYSIFDLIILNNFAYKNTQYHFWTLFILIG